MSSSQQILLYESPLQDKLSPKSSVSTLVTSPISRFQCSLQDIFCFEETRLHLFQPAQNLLQFSNKLSKKAVSWIMTICWSKSFNSQCLWTTLILFYAYKSKNNIDKSRLEAILLVCLQLSSKLNEGCPLKTSELFQYCTRPISTQDLLSIEHQLLLMVDFNLIFENCLTSFMRSGYFEEERMQMVFYVCELYLLRAHTILFDREKFQRVVGIIEGGCNYQECEVELTQIREMMGERESKILGNKFGSKFDLEAFHHMFA